VNIHLITGPVCSFLFQCLESFGLQLLPYFWGVNDVLVGFSEDPLPLTALEENILPEQVVDNIVGALWSIRSLVMDLLQSLRPIKADVILEAHEEFKDRSVLLMPPLNELGEAAFCFHLFRRHHPNHIHGWTWISTLILRHIQVVSDRFEEDEAHDQDQEDKAD